MPLEILGCVSLSELGRGGAGVVDRARPVGGVGKNCDGPRG
jgi:hypothetical protein